MVGLLPPEPTAFLAIGVTRAGFLLLPTLHRFFFLAPVCRAVFTAILFEPFPIAHFSNLQFGDAVRGVWSIL